MKALMACLTFTALATPAFAQPPTPTDPHSHHAPQRTASSQPPASPSHQEHGQPPDGVPPVTDEDRRAAFPDVNGHAVHDRAIHAFVLFDELEWRPGGADGFIVETNGWIGGDLNRFRFRGEGESAGDTIRSAEAHALYGRAIARWWDLVAGVRQDMRPGPARTWAALGIQGLAPYWFEVEATGYVGERGRTHARLEVAYELLLTNRLIARPVFEMDLYGKAIPESGIGAGFSRTEAGLRVRYEIRREFAPYVGVTWNRKYGGTADFARTAGEDVSEARLALGVRVWF